MRAFVRAVLASVAVLAAAPTLHAQGAVGASAPAGSPSTQVTPPVLGKHEPPAYPPAALRDRLEGTVALELTVDEAGHVSGARVTQAAGHGFDEAALAIVKTWTFTPAMRGGAPTKSSVQLALPFELPAPPASRPPPPATAFVAAPADPAIQRGPNQSTLVVAPRARMKFEPVSASASATSQAELSLIPQYKIESQLEAVPGLFAVQHSGGGKSSQYFLRGFDADHGTDIAFSFDGAPINLVSHGHGQGYSDINFIIPETIAVLDSTKGPYSVRNGDFATAGSVDFRMADHVAESYAKIEVGAYDHTRLVALESPDLGPDWRMLVAAQVFRDDGGPFIHPNDFDRFNAYVKTTHRLDERSEAWLTLSAYGGSWNASGVLPARAVCGEGDGTPTPAAYSGSRCISRWDSLDPSQGGDTQRQEGIVGYRRRFGAGTDLEASAYVIRYAFQLFPNDGIAAPLQPDGVQYGSQVEQDDARSVVGTRVQLTSRTSLGGIDVRSTYGIQLRNDAIHSELHRDQARKRLDGVDASIPGPITDSDIGETAIGFYAEEDFRPARWLRFVAGARGDRIDVAVSNASPTAVDQVSGSQGQAQLSPKASMIVTPWKPVELFANYGRGFHSNDARTIVAGSATTLLATATGYELGTVVRPVDGLSLGAVAFLLDVQSELTIDGDTASTSPSGATRRYGGEFTARYNLGDTVFADAALTIAHARYTDAVDVREGRSLVALAPVRTFSAGLGARKPVGPVVLFGSARVRSMSDRPATQDGSLTATGFTLVDLEIGARWKNLELTGMLLNAGDAVWREGQFAVQSRLPGESANPPVGMSFTPGIPRTAIASASLYW